MGERLADAANDRSILAGVFALIRGQGEELKGKMYDKVLHRVERRHRLPEGSGRIALQKALDDWRDFPEMLEAMFKKSDTENFPEE